MTYTGWCENDFNVQGYFDHSKDARLAARCLATSMPLIAARMFATPRSAYLQFKPTTISREDDGRGAIDCGHGSELAENRGHGEALDQLWRRTPRRSSGRT